MPALIPILVTVAVSVALSVGMRLISSLFAKPQQASFGGQLRRDPGSQLTMPRAADAKNIVFGKARVQGNIVFWGTSDNKRILNLIVEWAGHEIDGYEALYFGDEEVPLNGAGAATGKWSTYVFYQDFLGADDQPAASGLIAQMPSKWTSAHRGAGVAYSYIALHRNPALFTQGLPNMWRVVRGKKVYDPRTGTTGYSDNAALAVAAWLNDSKYGRGISYDDMDLDALEAAANVCDETVPLKEGGTEKRYTANGVLRSDTPFVDNLEKLLSASIGKAMFIGGKWTIKAAAWEEPQFPSFTLADFRETFSAQFFQPKADSFNAAKGTFNNPARLWQKDDFPAVISSAYEIEDGGDGNGSGREFKDVYLEFTSTASMCQRLVRIDLRKARQPITFTAPLKPKGLRAVPGDVERFTVPLLGWVDKPFEVLAVRHVLGFGPGGDGGNGSGQGMGVIGVDLDLRETAEAIYAWTPTIDESVMDPAPNTTLPDLYDVLPPASLSVGEELYETRAIGVKARAVLSWGASPDAFVREYQPLWRLQGETEWRRLPRVTGLGTTIDDIAPGNWEFGVAACNRVTESDPLVVSREIKGLLEPPATPQNVTGVVLGNAVLFDWDPTPDLDVRIGGSMVVRHAPVLTGASWETATPVGKPFTGASAGGALPCATGTYLFRWRDSSGQYSTGLASWPIEQGNADGWSVLDTLAEDPAFTGAKTDCTETGGKLVLDAGEATGAYRFGPVDLATVTNVRVTGRIASQVINTNDLWDSAELVDSDEAWDEVVSGNEVSARLWVRKTDDDPAGSPVWGDWTPFLVAEFAARGLQFELRFDAVDTDYGLEVSELDVVVEAKA
jgi:hypothetical protein